MNIDLQTLSMDSSADLHRLPEPCGPPRLIVCEPEGRWATALRHEGFEADMLVETRALGTCWERLAESPASFCIVALTPANIAPLLARMAWWQRDFPLARLAVVAARSLVAHGELMREAGAVHFMTSPRRAGTLAELARRHLDAAPRARRSPTERIWAELPWSAIGVDQREFP